MNLKEERIKQSLSHFVREVRKVNGYPEGKEKCQCCGAMNATRQRQRTCYPNDEDNFKTYCPKCQEEEDEHWDDMWDEYYSMVM